MRMIKEMHPLCCITIEGHRPSSSSEIGSHHHHHNNDDSSSSSAAAADSALLLRTGSVIVRGSDYNGGGGGSDSGFTVAGMLYKWTNYHKGWRSRWFILRNGVISYAKTPNRPDCVSGDDVTLIGGGEFPSSSSSRHHRHSRSSSTGQGSNNRKSSRIVHLKISSFRESRSDDRRFYVFTCTKTLHLKTNSKAERQHWIECLDRTRYLFSHRPSSSQLQQLNDSLSTFSSSDISSSVNISTERLKKRLIGEGINNEVLIKDCEQIMLSEFCDVQGQLKSLCDQRSTLLHTLRHFEATNTEGEASGSGVNVGGYPLMKNDYPSAFRGKYGGEWSTTESSDDVEKQELEEVSDEEEPNFFDAYESFPESTASGGALVEDHMDRYGDLGSRSVCVRNDFSSSEFQRRKKLPDPVEKEKSVSLWSVIKDNVGKDLTRVCLPVYFNEPLSTLQKCFEEFEYSYLLDRAYDLGKMGNSLQRILYVAAFAVSGYSSTEGRQCKPFNPLLGETYEADYPEKGVRFFSEKVSHHPTIIACHCEGRGWKMWCDSNLKSKFWGRSIQLDPVGTITLEFDDGEIFQWNKVTSSIYNLILGKIYIDHSGTMHIRGNRDYSCKLKFKEPSILERNPHQVHGFVEDNTGAKVATLFGKWNESMYFVKGEGNNKSKDASLLWERDLPPKNLTRYDLSSFAITLNELTQGLKEKLPPTDSRLRPDQRFLENGEYDKANAEKLRLETRQRMSRKLQEDGWKPRWFERDSDGTYRYAGSYWESRELGNWNGCSNIFSEDHGKPFEGS